MAEVYEEEYREELPNEMSDFFAEGYLAKIKTAKEDMEREVKVCTDWVDYYKEKQEEIEAKYQRRIDFYTQVLENYFGTVEHKQTATQETYKLPSGTLKWTKPKKDYEVNEDILLPYLKENAPDFVKVTEKSMWGEYKKNLTMLDGEVVDTETGMRVDGVSIVEKPGKFEVK